MQLTELVAPPTEGRVFTDRARAGLGDVAPSGRVRLDTIARWLQDAAFADLLDSGVPDDGVWIVRRLRLRVERFPRMHEHVSVATWCSGAGEPRGRAAQHGARRRRRARRGRWRCGCTSIRSARGRARCRRASRPSTRRRRRGATCARGCATAASRRRTADVRSVALSRRRPRPRRPRQQRRVLAGARGGPRRRRRPRAVRRRDRAPRPGRRRRGRASCATGRCSGSPLQTAKCSPRWPLRVAQRSEPELARAT